MVNCIFVGGPGRSGTSVVAALIGQHPHVASFADVELKIFFEHDGLYDLRHVLTESYSPNRATVAIKRFEEISRKLIRGKYGPLPEATANASGRIEQAIHRFTSSFTQLEQPLRLSHEKFNVEARRLVDDLFMIARQVSPNAKVFLEKTPHNLLAPQFMHEISPNARFVHVIRDPRAIAASLVNQDWGPKTLEACVVWVNSYFESWIEARKVFWRFGLPMRNIRIEDIAADSDSYSKDLMSFLTLPYQGNVFAGSDPAVLARWVNGVTPENLDMLNRKLARWVSEFNYPERIEPGAVGPQAS
jgi:hypothetical protein